MEIYDHDVTQVATNFAHYVIENDARNHLLRPNLFPKNQRHLHFVHSSYHLEVTLEYLIFNQDSILFLLTFLLDLPLLRALFSKLFQLHLLELIGRENH